MNESVEHFEDAYESDETSPESKARVLNILYTKANDEGKEIIDAVFIALCGFSYKTLENETCPECGKWEHMHHNSSWIWFCDNCGYDESESEE